MAKARKPPTTTTSVTRLGNLLHVGQLFKAFGNNYFAQIVHIIRHFFSEIIFGQLLYTFGDFLLVTLTTKHQKRGGTKNQDFQFGFC